MRAADSMAALRGRHRACRRSRACSSSAISSPRPMSRRRSSARDADVEHVRLSRAHRQRRRNPRRRRRELDDHGRDNRRAGSRAKMPVAPGEHVGRALERRDLRARRPALRRIATRHGSRSTAAIILTLRWPSAAAPRVASMRSSQALRFSPGRAQQVRRVVRRRSPAVAAPSVCTRPRRRADRRVGPEQALRRDAPDAEDQRRRRRARSAGAGTAGSARLPRRLGSRLFGGRHLSTFAMKTSPRSRPSRPQHRIRAAARRGPRTARPGDPRRRPAPRRRPCQRARRSPMPNTVCVRVCSSQRSHSRDSRRSGPSRGRPRAAVPRSGATLRRARLSRAGAGVAPVGGGGANARRT